MVPVDNINLCQAMLTVARQAAARLWISLANDGWLQYPPIEMRGHLDDAAGKLGASLDALGRMWPSGRAHSAGRLLSLLGDDRHHLAVLALAAAPQLDPSIGRIYRNLHEGGLTVGFLLELASNNEAERLMLAERLGANSALVAREIIEIDPVLATGAASSVRVAGAVIAALRGVEAGLPALVMDTVMPRADSRVDLAEFGVDSIDRPLLFGGVARERAEAAARLIADAQGQILWLCSPPQPDDPEPRRSWCRLLRDASLADAIIACELPEHLRSACAVAAAHRRFDLPAMLFARDIDSLPSWVVDDMDEVPWSE